MIEVFWWFGALRKSAHYAHGHGKLAKASIPAQDSVSQRRLIRTALLLGTSNAIVRTQVRTHYTMQPKGMYDQ
jgi:hypothetical protein